MNHLKTIKIAFRTITLIPFLGVVVFLSWGTITNYLKQTKTPSYIPVTAEIIESRVSNFTKYNRYRHEPPIIKYQYTVDNKTYVSKKLGYGITPIVPQNGTYQQSLVKAFPVSSTVTAYYNPKNPSESVLTTRQYFPTKLLAAISVLGLFALIFIVV